MLERVEAFQCAIEQAVIAVALQDAPCAAMRENIADLADTYDIAPRRRRKIENRPTRRGNAVVATIMGPFVESVFAGKRTSDDPPDVRALLSLHQLPNGNG